MNGGQSGQSGIMADPTPYTVSYNFANYQANNPATPLPAASVDNELANIALSVRSLVNGLKDVRRSDARLKNGIVTLESLSAGVILGLLGLNQDQAAAIDTQIAAIQDQTAADIAAGLAGKADLVHTHTALQVSVSAITGITGSVLQDVLAELRLLGPQTGDFRLSIDDTVAAGWVPCNDGTIGDATSGASTRANADTLALYTKIWNKVSDTYAPVQTGRGVSAAADFAAHKYLGLTKMLGRSLAVAGAGTGLTSRTNGETAGAETTTLAQVNLPAGVSLTVSLASGQGSHTHTAATNGNAYFDGANTSGRGYNVGGFQGGTLTVTPAAATLPAMTGTAALGGSGTAISRLAPTSFLHAFLKL
jgi:hypothetical protein